MPTWKNRFNELSTAQSIALENVKIATTQEEWVNATDQVKTTMNEISDFFTKYQAANSPNQDDEIQDS